MRWMREERITIAHLTPALAEMLAAGRDAGRADGLPCLRYIFFGGDRLTARCVARMRAIAPGAACVNFYGTTETPQAASCYRIPSGGAPAAPYPVPDAARTLPVGKGIDGVQLLVLNRADQPAGTGELGEICVRTPYLSRGYIDDAELTARKFVRNPFTAAAQDRLYRTGDLGRYHPNGDVEFHGRADRQVKIRGFRVEPAEIEAALTSHEKIRQAVVTVVEDDHAGPSLVAYTVCRETVPTLSLRGYLRRRLPDYMIPARFVTLDAIPLTPNGKVDYARLPPAGRGGSDRRGFEPPATPLERRIANVWEQVLGVERVGLRDNFFDLGGHSLMVVKAVAQIEKTMGIRVSLREFFGQTLGQFAAGCERALGVQATDGTHH
jgi:acyl-CoA synthetase (AMP-forming)/AMP-acid ligase II/acyl carrier protein